MGILGVPELHNLSIPSTKSGIFVYDNSWLPILTVIMDVWIFSAVDLPEDIWTMIMSYFVILTILASLGLPSVVISSIIAVFVIVQTAISAFMEGVFSQ